MISRRTALILGKVYEVKFVYNQNTYSGSRLSQTKTTVYREKLYDFLYENDYSAWFCNLARTLTQRGSVKSLIMRLHTGETQANATKDWSWEQRRKLGQQYLRELSEDIINDSKGGKYYKIDSPQIIELIRSLEVDGYIYRDNRLISQESDLLDVTEEQGILDTLYTSLALSNVDMFRSHLKLSEEAYLAGRWGDAIHNSRLVFEEVLREVAAKHSLSVKGATLPERTYSKPVEVRQYLENEGMLETKEREVIQYTYGLLSNVGSHPYMAEKDQARLLRHMALTLSQFVLLRLEGALKQTSQGSV